MASINPLRYRGYYYDQETGLYFLMSRYYDPAICRFINADDYASTGQGIIGHNMFAYCRNQPITRMDISGTADFSVTDGDDDNPFDDLAAITGGGGYSYGVSFATSMYSSLYTGGFYQTGYSFYEVYYNPAAASSSTAPATPSACFVAGTLVQGENGAVPIEDISAGDMVWAWDEATCNVALKAVVETYINETSELIHVFVNGEEIITTPAHPFHTPVKGWTEAAKLWAGDILVTVNGEYVVVEKVQHEIFEDPIAVYNFQVEGYHTYYVSDISVLVHNACNKPISPEKVSDSYIKQNRIDAHAFKNQAGQVPRNMLSKYDIYKDKANSNTLWVGTKQSTDWRQTNYTFKELTMVWTKD